MDIELNFLFLQHMYVLYTDTLRYNNAAHFKQQMSFLQKKNNMLCV